MPKVSTAKKKPATPSKRGKMRAGQKLNKPGYHIRHIEKGVLGELSKVEEELAELKDALEQGSDIMALVELADLYGALKHYLKTRFGMDMHDLKAMSNITERAFRNGRR